jgi:branched-chain amino acid transport system substrate-binding protein
MKCRFFSSVVLLLLKRAKEWFRAGTVAVLLTALGCSSKPALEPVWLGQLVPMEGPNRAFGQQAKQGVELAAAEAREAGQTVQGRVCAFLHVDSGDDSDKVRAETVRLLSVNKAVALMPGFDALSTETLLRESRSYNAPVVVPGELPTPADSDIVLSLGILPSVRGRLLARLASVDLKLRRAAVLTDSRRPIASAVANAFLNNWPRDSGRAAEEWTFTSAAERDERLGRILTSAPDVVVLACSVVDFRLLRPRLAVALPKTSLIYAGEDAGIAALQADLETRSEVYIATAFCTEGLTEAGRAFAKNYEQRFHELPDLFAAQSYDAARLLLDSLQRAAAPTRDALGKELAQRESFESVTGPIHWKDRQPRRRVFLISLQNNKPKLVSTTEPEEN